MLSRLTLSLSVILLASLALSPLLTRADSPQVRFAAQEEGDDMRSALKATRVLDIEPAGDASPAGAESSHATDDDVPTELVTTRHPNRKPKIQKRVAQDEQRNFINHGPFTMWDPQGNMIATGHFAMGKRHGTWSRLQMEKAGHFQEPAYQGFKAPFVWETHFENDVLHGTWIVLDAEGRPVHSWQFEHGKLHGKTIDWFPNGKKRQEAEYEQGIPHGERQEWDEEGDLIRKETFQDGHPYKRHVEKDQKGTIRVEGWLLGAREKVRIIFNFWEGTVKIRTSQGAGADERHGKWSYYDERGRRKYSGDFEHNVPAGTHTWWHANGHKRIEGTLVDGKEEGAWTWWYPNGQKEQTGNYVAGERKGEWTSWDRQGRFMEAHDYSGQNASAAAATRPPKSATAAPPVRITAQPHFRASTRPVKELPEILQHWWGDRDIP